MEQIDAPSIEFYRETNLVIVRFFAIPLPPVFYFFSL
jgi:hypothetical protein